MKMMIDRLRKPRALLWPLGAWGCAALVMLLAAGLIFQPDPHDQLRATDRLFAAGRYHEALQHYQTLAAGLPAAQLRLGAIRAIRSERPAAERLLRGAMQRGLSPVEYQLALLYLGRVLADDSRPALAARTWALADDCRSPEACAYRALALVLLAEETLRSGDYPAAEAGYRAALATPMPPGWAGLAHYRLALLQASRDPQAAQALLDAAAPPAAPAAPLLAPLLPSAAGAGQLAALLADSSPQRAQQLGQFYLGLGFYGLAEAQFALVAPGGPAAVGAAAYAAYTRYRAGDRQGGLERLERLVSEQPAEPRARTLLALAYVSADAGEAAREQIDAVARLTPNAPDLHLAWASWYVAQRDYAQAALEYGRAMIQAPAVERPRYALVGARFHLSSSFELCSGGLTLAELAAAGLPSDAGAWSALAASRYRCGQFAPAADAARQALLFGAGAEAAYYLGAALAALGEGDAARNALIRAADLAPASIWRERAELALSYLP